jgi:hypothetical protein
MGAEPAIAAGAEAASGLTLVRLLDADPDLADGVDEAELERAQRQTLATVISVAPGPWSPAGLRGIDGVEGAFAALVLGGLVARDVALADRVATQFVGGGDALALAEPAEPASPIRSAWRVAAQADIAILDERFLAASQRFPWLTARLVERAARWSDRAAALQAMSQLARVDLRIVALLWHLADRWGRVAPDGILIPLRLTHEAIGHLVGAQRPTVTLALRDLRQAGLLERHGHGWRLSAESRALLEPAEGLELPSDEHDLAADIELESKDLWARARSARDQAEAGRQHSVLSRAEAIRTKRALLDQKLPKLD